MRMRPRRGLQARDAFGTRSSRCPECYPSALRHAHQRHVDQRLPRPPRRRGGAGRAADRRRTQLRRRRRRRQRRAVAGDRDHLQPRRLPLPRGDGARDLRDERAQAQGARGRAARLRRTRLRARGREQRRPRGVPALHRAGHPRGEGRPEPRVAAAAPAGDRPGPAQQPRRLHQLRALRAGPADPRLRPRHPARGAHPRAPGPQGRALPAHRRGRSAPRPGVGPDPDQLLRGRAAGREGPRAPAGGQRGTPGAASRVRLPAEDRGPLQGAPGAEADLP